MLGNTAKVLLVDGSVLFREGIRRLLNDTEFEVTGETDHPRHGVDLANGRSSPDLVLVDVTAVEDATVERLRKLRENLPDSRIVVLGDEVSTVGLIRALQAGVDAYLLKDLSAEALVQSLNLVMVGEKVFPTQLAHHLLKTMGNGGNAVPSTEKISALSPREIEVLRCLLDGASNKEIANRLHITEATVKVHLKGLLKKINAANRTQAAIWAVRNEIELGPVRSGHSCARVPRL